MEQKILDAEEVILKKLKQQHIREDRLQHRHATQQMYDEALELYRQQRMSQAQAAFDKVETALPDYKSTTAYEKIADKRTLEELQYEMRRIKAVNNIKMMTGLENRALLLYQQAASLARQEDTPAVRGQLAKLKDEFRQLSQEVYVRRQLDKIAQEAQKFDQQIFQLTQAGDYPAARTKLIEFQKAMIAELAHLKEDVQYNGTLFTIPNF
jgi:hypothetical protein